MRFSDLKYFFAFSIPFTTYLAVVQNGWVSYLTLIYAFGIIPVLEQIIPLNKDNQVQTESGDSREKNLFFEALLFLNLPLTGVLLYLAFNLVSSNELSTFDIIGKTISVGIFLGACGINVAHELGHKQGLLNQLGAKLLLTPCLYNHFTLQHNRGHHLNVSTPLDPATAIKNEVVYSFWIKSIVGTMRQAWELEITRLKRMDISFFNLKNEMLINTILTIIYISTIIYFFNFTTLLFAIVAGIISILLLETINYIEHYGLSRKLLPSGRYENVEMTHSWNSDHQLGRIVLYELTRHADHHYKANKKYQTLLHYDESPQLPLGYPGSMLLSLVPFAWFKKMNPLVDRFNASRG